MTNEWIERSVQLANSRDYLLRLSQIYPATLPQRRPLDPVVRQKIVELHRMGNGIGLLRLLLSLRRKGHPFPIEHPYVSLLSESEYIFNNNPGIVKIIADILLSMNVEDIIRGCERPPDINRIMGQSFRNWVKRYFPTQGYSILPVRDFEVSQSSAILDGTNSTILEYVRRRLGIDLEKGRDILVKLVTPKGTLYVVGEARFLTTSGGSQTRDLEEVISFVNKTSGNLIRIGILDGIVWFYRKYLDRIRGLGEGKYVLSALLLKEFLDWLRERFISSAI